jgi:CDP-diacylglycerol--serine O-phosphatidyltransferase
VIFIGYPHRKRTVPFRLLLPNMLTTVALCAGLASVHFSLKATAAREGHGPELVSFEVDRLWEKAMLCILISAVFDMLDGLTARLLKVQSPFGAILDSLSDFLSFGIAPALLLHQWTLSDCVIGRYHVDALGLAAVMTFALCSALRLARFTAAARAVKTAPGTLPPPEPRPHPHASRYFVGMPTPAAAGAVLIPAMLAVSSTVHWVTPDWLVVLWTFLIALLMIGRQPMFSLKKLRIPRRLVVPMMVGLGLVIAAGVKYPLMTAVAVCGGYLLLTPVSMVVYRRSAVPRASGERRAP